MRTYINEQGVLVTDTRIITEEFKKADNKFRHFSLLKVVDRILESEKVNTSNRSPFSIEKHIIISEYKKYKNSKTTEKMYQLSEYGFILVISELNVPKLKGLAQKLYSIRKTFIHEFFRLREENAQLKQHIANITGKEFKDIALPDTLDEVSKVNGQIRDKWVRGYGRSKKGSKKNSKTVIGIQKSLFDL